MHFATLSPFRSSKRLPGNRKIRRDSKRGNPKRVLKVHGLSHGRIFLDYVLIPLCYIR